tara:strand:+ start:1173 stop:1313 length:141 start_codon:yes stop_codon:yes gene_type:complete
VIPGKLTQVPEDDSKAGEERCLETESLCQKMAGEELAGKREITVSS